MNILFQKKEKHYIEYVLPFFMLLAQYKIGFISLSTIVLAIISFAIVLNKKFKIPILAQYKYFFPFFFYVVFRDIIKIFVGYDIIQVQFNRIIEYVFSYFLVFIICTQRFDEDKFFKVYKFASSIYILGLFYHIISLYFLKQNISPISIIPGYVLRSEEIFVATRPCSFFAEPASFAVALLPMLFISLRRQDIKWAVILTISILLSTSTIGVVLVFVLWCCTLVKHDISFKKKLLMFLAAVCICFIFFNLNIFNDALKKLILVSEGGSTFSSRVQCSFEVLKTINPFSLISGTNYNEINNYIINNYNKFSNMGSVIRYYKENTVFLNTFAQIIFKYGIIGMILWLIPFNYLLKNDSYTAKPFLIMIIFAIFAQSMLLNSYYFMIIMIILLYTQKANINYKVRIEG